MATVPTATTGHDNTPGSRMTVRALMNECKRHPAVEVLPLGGVEWRTGTLLSYGQVGDMGGVAFNVDLGAIKMRVSEDRIRFPQAPAIPDDLPLACGCPRDTPQRQVSEYDVQCDGCGRISA